MQSEEMEESIDKKLKWGKKAKEWEKESKKKDTESQQSGLGE